MIKETNIEFTCDLCGKVVSYNPNSGQHSDIVKENTCWRFTSNRDAGYGSKYDGMFISFDLCEDCLSDLIDNSLTNLGNYYGREVEIDF